MTTIYKIERYTGNKIGAGFMERVGVQIVATDSKTGKRVYAFGNSPCYKIPCGAAHGITGPSKATSEQLQLAEQYLIDNLEELTK